MPQSLSFPNAHAAGASPTTGFGESGDFEPPDLENPVGFIAECRLFPPPEEARTDETTGTVVACRLRDKGRQRVTVTTICGCVEVWRKRWMSAIGAGCWCR